MGEKLYLEGRFAPWPRSRASTAGRYRSSRPQTVDVSGQLGQTTTFMIAKARRVVSKRLPGPVHSTAHGRSWVACLPAPKPELLAFPVDEIRQLLLESD